MNCISYHICFVLSISNLLVTGDSSSGNLYSNGVCRGRIAFAIDVFNLTIGDRHAFKAYDDGTKLPALEFPWKIGGEWQREEILVHYGREYK